MLLKWRRQDDCNLAEYNRWALVNVTAGDVEAYRDELISELAHGSY